MTAPLRASDPTLVNVALGERSYDIIIGRGQLALLGQRLVAPSGGDRERSGRLWHCHHHRHGAAG